MGLLLLEKMCFYIVIFEVGEQSEIRVKEHTIVADIKHVMNIKAQYKNML